MKDVRKKDWSSKVEIVKLSLVRAMTSSLFAKTFYENLFYLNPKLKDYFRNTDWKKQEIALIKGVDHLMGFFADEKNEIHRKNIVRLAESHSKNNLNIHPHKYYYWIDAMVMTLRELDHEWEENNQFYVRECLFFPVSFIISLYHKS